MLALSTILSATGAPSPAPAPSPALARAPKHIDPCGGPQELLNKVGLTACVFVVGEAALTAAYGSANVPSNTQVNFTTNRGNGSFSLSGAAHLFGYPAPVIYAGVSPRAQITITPPSFLQVNSRGAGALTGNSLLAAGATDMKFAYKQLLGQSDFFTGKQEKSNRDGFVIYVGNAIFGVKWQNWKMMSKEIETGTDALKEYSIPRFYSLYLDPTDEHTLSYEPQYAWVRFPCGKILTEHATSLKKHPPIPPGAPDPYSPKES